MAVLERQARREDPALVQRNRADMAAATTNAERERVAAEITARQGREGRISADGQEVLAAQAPATPHIDGVPLEEAIPGAKEQAARHMAEAAQLRSKTLTPETARRLAKVLKEKGAKGVGEDMYKRGVATLRAYIKDNPDALAGPNGDVDPRIDTSPMPTGIERVDRAGERIVRTGGGNTSPFVREIPSLDELPPDHPLVLRKNRADQGVDMISGAGLDFGDRASIAMTPNIGELRQKKIASVLGGIMNETPDDLPKFRYDPALAEFQILKPSEEEGKYRWTSLDGTGIELGDFADLLDLGEIGGLTGSLIGTGKATKVFNFHKAGTARQLMQAGTGGFAGGTLGRFGGDGVGIIINYMNTGEVPTLDELIERGWDGAKIEAFASATGELGGLILRGAARRIQGGKFTGGEQISDADLAAGNRNMEQTRRDMQTLRDATGREDFAVTPGQASRSIQLLSDEADALANASSRTRKAFIRQQVQNNRNVKQYINENFGGDPKYMGDQFGTIKEANDALGTAGRITVGVNEQGTVKFSPKLDPENGLKVKPGVKVGDHEVWQIQGVLLDPTLRDTGLGAGLYKAAKDEAERHGRTLASDTDLSEDALRMWKKLEGEEGFEELVWNPTRKVKVVDGDGRTWYTTEDGNPLVMIKPREPYTTQLLKAFRVNSRDANGKFKGGTEPGPEFGRFLRRPGRKELGAVTADINKNPYIKQDLKDAIFSDYQKSVYRRNAKGRQVFDPEMWLKWKNGISNNVMEEVFTPEEMLMIRSRPNGLRQIVEEGRRHTEQSREILASVLKVDTKHELFRDPTSRTLFNQFRGREQPARRRIMRLLDAQDMGDGIRELFKGELRRDLIQMSRATDSGGFTKWLERHEPMIKDVLDTPQQEAARRAAASRGGQVMSYVDQLKFIGRMIDLKGASREIRSTVAEANPSSLGLFRVIFGPLSRFQRFLTGSRKAMVRSNAAGVADLVADPNALNSLFRIKDAPLASRITARTLQDLGIIPWLGLDEESFDADNADDRDQLKRRVTEMLNASIVDE